MIRINAWVVALMLCACASEPPEQFVPSDQRVIVPGCEELKIRVNEWNAEHPDQLRVADC